MDQFHGEKIGIYAIVIDAEAKPPNTRQETGSTPGESAFAWVAAVAGRRGSALALGQVAEVASATRSWSWTPPNPPLLITST